MHLSHRQYTTRLSQKLQRWLHRKSRRLSEVRPEMAAELSPACSYRMKYWSANSTVTI